MPLCALSMAVLLTCFGAVLDVGRLAVVKARMQARCDLAALAGAGQEQGTTNADIWDAAAGLYCANVTGGEGGLEAQFQAHVDQPGVDGSPDGATYHVGDETVTVIHPYRDAYTDDHGWDPSSLTCVKARQEVEMLFLRVVGVGPVHVVARAVARGVPGGGQLAIFAHRTDEDPYGFKWTGSGGEIQGNAQSNSRVWFTGSAHYCTGWVEYRYRTTISGSGHQVDGGYIEGEIEDYPVNFTPADFEPYDYIVDGKFKITGSDHTIPAGVYYVKGDVDISGSNNHASGPVTFVAEGKISVSGSGMELTAARNDTLFYTLTGDNTWDLDISGSGGRFTGLCFAPNGSIQYSGSGHNIYEGCLIGDKILVTGSDFVVHGTGGGPGKMEVSLVR